MRFPFTLPQIWNYSGSSTNRKVNVDVWAGTAVSNSSGFPAVSVNDKTGFSLTAGSYSVRASAMQPFNIDINAPSGSGTQAVSSVTTTRALVTHNGHSVTTATTFIDAEVRFTLTSSILVTGDRSGSTNRTIPGFTLSEFF